MDVCPPHIPSSQDLHIDGAWAYIYPRRFTLRYNEKCAYIVIAITIAFSVKKKNIYSLTESNRVMVVVIRAKFPPHNPQHTPDSSDSDAATTWVYIYISPSY